MPDVSLTNAALDSLLDSLENRLGSRPLQSRPLGVAAQGWRLRRCAAALVRNFRSTGTRKRDGVGGARHRHVGRGHACSGRDPGAGSAGPAIPRQGDRARIGPVTQRGPALATSSDLPSPANSPGEKKSAAAEAPSASDESDSPNLDIEDDVIRELARSLRPNRK